MKRALLLLLAAAMAVAGCTVGGNPGDPEAPGTAGPSGPAMTAGAGDGPAVKAGR